MEESPIPDSGDRAPRDLPRSQLFVDESFDALHIVSPKIISRDSSAPLAAIRNARSGRKPRCPQAGLQTAPPINTTISYHYWEQC